MTRLLIDGKCRRAEIPSVVVPQGLQNTAFMPKQTPAGACPAHHLDGKRP